MGHNAHFDLNFLNAAVARSGHKRNPFHPFSVFDTVTLAGVAYGQTVLARAVQLVGLDWTLFVEGRETVSGIFNDQRVLPSGMTTDIPISMELDLVRFFGRNAPDLINLALNLAGAGGSPAMLRLEAQPSINTEFGPIRYPGRIGIEYEVGR